MKKLISALLLTSLCASTAPVKASLVCGPCVHVHHSSDDWAGPMAFGAIVGTGLGLAATAASRDHGSHHSRAMVNDLEEQNEILRARVNSLRDKVAELRAENEELREQNEALRRKIKKMKCSCSGEVMVKVATCE